MDDASSPWGWPFAADTEGAHSKGIDMEGLFPFLFSFCCFVLFLVPIWLMVHLGHDPNVVYWVGHWCEVALVVPLPFFAAFFIQDALKRAHKPTILACLLLPSATLLVLGNMLVNTSSNRADQLRSMDCDTFPKKRSLQRSWEAAQRLYVGCLRETLSSHNITMETATRLFRVQDCTEFEVSFAEYEQDWTYLWWLEEENQCAGWCFVSQPLWTQKAVWDSCSVAVSQAFDTKAQRMAQQVVAFSTTMLLIATLGNLAVGPSLRAAGLDW